jgi:hypothetical protein
LCVLCRDDLWIHTVVLRLYAALRVYGDRDS